jgi:hypothetical protein
MEVKEALVSILNIFSISLHSINQSHILILIFCGFFQDLKRKVENTWSTYEGSNRKLRGLQSNKKTDVPKVLEVSFTAKEERRARIGRKRKGNRASETKSERDEWTETEIIGLMFS